jgi:hypothetical protein
MNTFSWMQGQLFPGSAVLHFNEQSGKPTLQVSICPMHNQLRLYVIYGIVAGLTFLLFMMLPLKSFDREARPSLSNTLTKLQNIGYRLRSFALFFIIVFTIYLLIHFLLL